MKVGVASTTPGHLAGSVVQCIFSFKHTLPSLPCCGVPRICLQGACVGFVLCDWDNINCYWNMEGYRIRKLVEALRVSPLPNDATTGIVHCDAPLFLSCYTIPSYTPGDAPLPEVDTIPTLLGRPPASGENASEWSPPLSYTGCWERT